MKHPFAFCGSALMALGVGLGAFGAHALKHTISPELLEVFEKAVLYHFVHALAVILVGLMAHQKFFSIKVAAWLGVCFAAGIFLFCGSLYIYTIFNYTPIVMITPVGGSLFIAGWLLMAIKLVK